MIVFLILAVAILAGNYAGASVSFTPDWERISGKMLPDIEFIDAFEQDVRISDYQGKILILHPMFTHCPSTCLLVSSRLEGAIRGLSPKERNYLRVVSFSFDPGETSEGLAKFERMFHVDGSLWKVVRAKPDMIHRLLTALDFRTLQLNRANYEHANLVFVVGNDRILLDYIYGSELTSERLAKSLRLTQKDYTRQAVKSYIFLFGVIGLLISAFVAAQQLTKGYRHSN